MVIFLLRKAINDEAFAVNVHVDWVKHKIEFCDCECVVCR
jgi:hypothetical protein